MQIKSMLPYATYNAAFPGRNFFFSTRAMAYELRLLALFAATRFPTSMPGIKRLGKKYELK